MTHPRSAHGGPPRGGATGGSAEPDPRRPLEEGPAARCQAYAACSALAASPHESDPREASAALAGTDLATLRRDYSALFEVGDEGPPLPLRAAARGGGLASVREDIVRFYEHFHYTLAEAHAWQADHLSVQLEFMQLLCWREAQADGPEAAQPWQRAQADFAERHLVPWLPELAADVARLAPASPYAAVFAQISDFVCDDAARCAEQRPA